MAEARHPPEQTASLAVILALLVSAAFFDGYDGQIFSLLLPQIQDSFHASVTALGIAHVPIAFGQFVAFFVIREADRFGRRPLLLWTIVGYTAFSAATAAAWNIWSFAALQFGAQIFIGAEFAVAVTMLVEAFPEARRGRALGLLLTFGPLGAVMVAVLLDLGIQHTSLNWRLFYLIGLPPLVLVALARRRLPETAAFERERQRRKRGESRPKVSLLEPWLPAYRPRLVLVGMVSLLQTLPASAAVAWWAYYAERQRGLSTGEVATYVIFAYGAGLLGYYTCGRVMDRIGRRRTAVIYMLGTVAAGAALFQSGRGLLTPILLALAVFFGLGIGPVLSAFATELFPTRIRTQASSWVRNWFAVIGSALGPSMVGVLGDPYRGAIGNIGDTVTLLTFLILPGAFLVWRFMPETRGMTLEPATATPGIAPAVGGAAGPDRAGAGVPAAGSGGRAGLVEPAAVASAGAAGTASEADVPAALGERAGIALATKSAPDARLKRSFAFGLAGVLLALGAISGVVLTIGSGQQRPAGAAQEWLFDLSGTTASSGRQASLEAAAKLGPPALGRPLIAASTRGEDAFTRISVGTGRSSGSHAAVPFTLDRPHGASTLSGTLELERTQAGWRVVGVEGVHPGVSVPAPASPGLPGPRAAWAAGALFVVLAVAALSSLAIRVSGGVRLPRQGL